MTYAKKLNWTSENPCLSLTKLKENAGRDRVLSQEEIQRLLIACRESRSPYLYIVVLISISTGARQGEILTLEWKHVNFDSKLAYLQETKNGRPRSISLVDPVIAELQNLYQNRNPLKPLVFASKMAYAADKKLDTIFISALAYHLIQNCMYQRKKQGICSEWKTILARMSTRVRVTMRVNTDEGKTLYHRSTTKAEGNQPQIYKALGLFGQILKATKTIV